MRVRLLLCEVLPSSEVVAGDANPPFTFINLRLRALILTIKIKKILDSVYTWLTQQLLGKQLRCVYACLCVCVWERERQTDRQTDRLISKHRAVYFVYLKFYKGMEKRNNYIIRILPFQLQFPFSTTQVNWRGSFSFTCFLCNGDTFIFILYL